MPLKDKRIKNDIILIAVILLVAVVGLILFNSFQSKGASVEVIKDGKTFGIYDLNRDDVIDVDGYLTVVIKDGKVSVKDSKCKNGYCSSHEPISFVGQIIVCLPNDIVIKITGQEGADVVI